MTDSKIIKLLADYEVNGTLSTSNLYQPDFNRVMGYLNDSSPTLQQTSPLTIELEKRLCRYHDAAYCVSFSSGFWALVAAISLKSLKGKRNVIIPSLTYRRLADVVAWCGKVPVFVDVNKDNLAISVEAVRRSVDSETSLILAVHPIVNSCDVASLLDLSQELNIPLIFDAVESVHETFQKKRIGSFGVGEVFSFHASKLINGFEGGYVCTNDEFFAQELRQFINFGVTEGQADTSLLGVDARPIDAHAAFALAGLDEIVKNVKHNKAIYEAYKKNMGRVRGVHLIEFDSSEQTSYKNIVAEVGEDFPLTRDSLVEVLNEKGVLARKYYSPALHEKEHSYE
jgi:dTDP-4-amino-4,6-dideoxygalactose transaminase